MKPKHFGAGALCAVLLAAIAFAPPALARDKSKRPIKDISVTKPVDKATPTMARKKSYVPPEERNKYLKYEMKSVTVSTKSGGSSGGPKGSQPPQGATKRK